jgi:hypothetical protein
MKPAFEAPVILAGDYNISTLVIGQGSEILLQTLISPVPQSL